MSNHNVYGYTLRDNSGRILYVGITNNIRARQAEHRLEGKRFAEFQIETKPMSRRAALNWEARRLKSYRDFTGRNPLYNKTDDGGFTVRDRRSRARRPSQPPARARQPSRPPARARRPSQSPARAPQPSQPPAHAQTGCLVVMVPLVAIATFVLWVALMA